MADMKTKLSNDEDIIEIQNAEHLHSIINRYSETDEWISPFICELGVIGVHKNPIVYALQGQKVKGVKLNRNGYEIPMPQIDLEVEENRECVEEGYGVFLAHPGAGGYTLTPTRKIAFQSICDRAGDACSTMLRFDRSANRQVLPIEEKAERLSRDMLLYSDDCNGLIRDGKISFLGSKAYKILPEKDLVEALETVLKTSHPNLTFSSGLFSHEYLMVEYLLNNEEMEESFKLLLEDAGMKVETLKAGVRFSTSSVGYSAVKASCFYLADKVRFSLGSGIYMEHSGNASIDEFTSRLQLLGNCFKENEKRIEELGNMDIANIGKVLRAIREKYTVLSRSITDDVAKEYETTFAAGGATGIDVYMALNEIIQRQANGASPTTYINLYEMVERMMRLPFAAIDRGEDWHKV